MQKANECRKVNAARQLQPTGTVFCKSPQNNIAKGKTSLGVTKMLHELSHVQISQKGATETLASIDFEHQSTVFTA